MDQALPPRAVEQLRRLDVGRGGFRAAGGHGPHLLDGGAKRAALALVAGGGAFPPAQLFLGGPGSRHAASLDRARGPGSTIGPGRRGGERERRGGGWTTRQPRPADGTSRTESANFSPMRAGPLLPALLLAAGASRLPSQTPPAPSAPTPYTLYVSSESGDIVTRIEVGPGGWRKVREVPVGVLPTDIDGPHNVAVSADGRFWYVSIAHGTPYGSVWKFSTDTDSLLGRVQVGAFPTTVGLSPDGGWAWVPNSDFHGDRGGVNTVSAIYTPPLTQVTQLPVCDMPHGSRYNHAGTRVYIACMMSDEVVAIDPATFRIVGRAALGRGGASAMAAHEHEGSGAAVAPDPDRKSTRLNSSPGYIS